MPEAAPAVLSPKGVSATGEELVPFTCPWAQDGLRRAMDGLISGGSGVSEYHIGTRGLHYRSTAEQAKTVDYWMKMVEFYCGTDALPPALTGRDTACRVIPRDV
jgi:hypothetical protein